MSGRILARLMDTVKNALKEEVHITGTCQWLDSKTALWWINNKGEWKQFVRQRVNEILRLTRKEDWAHCPGEQNPADVGSRGERASKLKENELWWKGPYWLSGPQNAWPVSKICETSESTEEEKKVIVTLTNVEAKGEISNVIDIKRFSRLGKLLRVTVWVRRFLHNLRTAKIDAKGRVCELQGQEIVDAQRWKIAKFGFGTRGTASIVIPRDHHFTRLVIEECNRTVLHTGVRSTVGELRSRFWIPKGRQLVKVLRECVTCKRQQGKPFASPLEAALPDFRVREAIPFCKVGGDFAGPLFVKSPTGEMVKSYIALFTCCVTRAVHLDLVTDLSASTFVQCLRRFAARRGTPSLIISDNAKTFKAAEKWLRRLHDDQEVREHLESNRIDWRFNLERAPWWGGFYERLIGTAKRCLRKVFGNARLNSDEILTVLMELEATLNLRPLTYEYDEIGAEMLTPSHLIYGRRLLNLPELRNDLEESETSLLRRFRYLARMRTHFWNRWRKEYLTDLREHHRSKKESHVKVNISDVFLFWCMRTM
ncbi:uncharacterized protein [Montipora capricornis]|uniref:uncharacterized protein n=1 Tax=Montipora capricornis TaxID=246305 RepID=UPI0035F107D7